MAIAVQCGGCGRVYKVGDDKAGGRFKRKSCAQVITVRHAQKTRTVSDDMFDDQGTLTASAHVPLPRRTEQTGTKAAGEEREPAPDSRHDRTKRTSAVRIGGLGS